MRSMKRMPLQMIDLVLERAGEQAGGVELDFPFRRCSFALRTRTREDARVMSARGSRES